MYNENKGFPYKSQPSVPVELMTDDYYVVKDNSGKTTVKTANDLTVDEFNIFADGGMSKTGKTYLTKNPGANSKMSIDVETGKIKITVPETALKNETFKKQMSDAASTISQNYRLNPGYKYALLKNSDETKDTFEWIDEINKELPQMVNQAYTVEKIKDDTRAKDGVELSDKDVIKMNSIALEYNDENGETVQVKDSTVQSLPEKIKALNVFKNIEGWDANEHTVTWENLKKEWNREKHSDEDILDVFKAVDDYFAKKDFSDPSEYAEMSAIRQFIYGKDPNVGFWRNIAETTGETMLGIITGTAAFDAGLISAIEGISNGFRDTIDRMAGNEPGATEHLTWAQDTLIPDLQKWVEERRSTTAKLSDARAGWGSVTNTLTPIAMEIAVSVWAGNAASKFVTGTVNNVIQTTMTKYGASVASLANTAQMLGMTGKAAEFAEVVNNTKGIAESLYVGADLALKLMGTAKAAEVMVASFKLTAAITRTGAIAAKGADILAQAVVDISLNDPKLFRTLMESDDAEAKAYALEQLTQNAAGEIIGLGIGKGLMKFGSSDLGLILQAKTAPKISGIKAKVGQAADNIKTWLHHGDADWLKNKTDKIREAAERNADGRFSTFLYNRAGRYERKLQNLTERRILRAANEKIGEMSDYISNSDTWEETLEKAREIKGKMADTLAEANNLINDMYKRDVASIVARFYMDNPDLDASRLAYVEKLSKVIRAENAAGLGGKNRRMIEITQEVTKSGKKAGKVESIQFGLINEKTNEYIVGQYRLETARAYAELSEIPDKVARAKKEIEYYEGVVRQFRETQPKALVDAADDLLEEGKKLSGLTQDLRVTEGVMAEDQLNSLRTSGYFDGGYMRIQREKEWAKFRNDGGRLKISEPRGIDEYGWGDVDDKFQDISLVLFDDINEVARQTNRMHMTEMLKDLGFKVETVAESDSIRIVTEAKQSARKAAIDTIQKNVRNLVKNNADTDIFTSFFDKKGARWFINQAEANAESAGGKLAKIRATTNPRVTSSYKVKYIDDAPITEINGILADNNDALFRTATRSDNMLWKFRNGLDPYSRKMLDERMIAGVGRNYNIPYTYTPGKKPETTLARRTGAIWNSKLKGAELADTGKISASDLKKLYTVDNFRINSDIDKDFIESIKRQYVYRKYGNTDDVVNRISNAKYNEDVFRAETLYKENLEKLEAMRKKYDMPDFDTRVADDIEDFIEEAITANYDSKVVKDVANALADGTAGLDDLVEYTTLQSLYRNRNDIKNKFYTLASDRYNQALTTAVNKKYASKNIDEIREKYATEKIADLRNKYAGPENAEILKKKIAEVKEKNALKTKEIAEAREMNKLRQQKRKGIERMANDWANETTEMLAARIEERYAESANRLMRQGSDLVDDETRKSIFKRIGELNKEITATAKGDNVIKTYGAYGYEEYVEVSPTVADMFTTMPRPLKRGTFGEIQQQFVRIFRFGTTGGLVPGSLVNQAFRDFGNAITMGDAVRTNARVEAELAELFGERFAQEYQRTVPDVYATLLKKSEETGEDINRLIAKREMKLGEINVDAQLEQNIYNFGKEARFTRNARGNYDQTIWDGVQDRIDIFQNNAERLNTMREVYLRKRVYNNALLSSLKQGLSTQQARSVAEFIQSEATTNFARQSYHFANLTKTVPYLGSAINGQKSFWRLLAWDPIGVSTRIIGGYVVPVIVLTNMTLANESDRRIYEQIPEYEKAEHLTFVINGQILSIPVPQEISNFVTPVQHLIESLQGANDHSFNDLLLNDLLGSSPIELDGFMNIDADQLLEQNIFERNLIPGVAKISSTLMKPLEKAGFMMVTGYDPYTMKKVNRNNYMLDYDTGERVPMNTQAGSLAKLMGEKLDGFMSATMAEKVLRNLFGQGNVLLFDNVITLGSMIVDKDVDFIEGAQTIGQEYLENAGNRVMVERYGEEVNLAWNRAVNTLWDEKLEILNDKKYKDDIAALQGDSLSEDARNEILSRVRTRQQEFMNEVYEVANNLVEKYDGTFDRNKFAAVISLMNFESREGSQLPENSYSDYLGDQQKQINRAAAVETMARMGFRNSNDMSAFGYYYENPKTGEVTVQYNTPLSILNYNNTVKWQDEIAFADIRTILNEKGLYDAHEALRNQINAIYANKTLSKQDRANIEKMQIEWNYKVAETLAPVLAKMTPDAAVNNKKVKDLLYTYIEVPGSFQVNNKGRFVSLGDNGSKKAAYYSKWIDKLFNMKSKYDN